MPHEIQRVLMLSTGHLNVLELGFVSEVATFTSDYGWLVSVHREASPRAPSLLAAVALAKQLSCDFVRFDADGPVVEELPAYEW